MERTPVIIVGAGPSGLVLGLSLARYGIKSVILERELQVTDDPRGVALAGDAVRVLWGLGIQDEFARIGHEQKGVEFHKGSLTTPAFYRVDTQSDWRRQAVPDIVMQIQPELERALRQKIETSEYCELRCGCEVISVEEIEDGMLVQYCNKEGLTKKLVGSWLVGADGKRGYIRKHYLEPVAGVKQETGLFSYEGTWIAANLHIKLPTPESHPDLGVWDAGLTPTDVYDLFWPEHLHFICPPGKPTATMRFGPASARLWRHEFTEPQWQDGMDAEKLLWEHLLPMVTRDSDGSGRSFERTTFPRDCVEVRRCHPYAFSQKVVNKWFHKRTILIGDAAHTVPPFGGQGITAGIGDAQALAWRLALFESVPELEQSAIEEMLMVWSHERKEGVDNSARFTKANGQLVNEEEKWIQTFLRTCAMAIQKIPIVPHIQTETERAEEQAYRTVKDGFFLSVQQGGGKAAQVYLHSNSGKSVLSDEVLKHRSSLMTLLAFDNTSAMSEVEQLLEESGLPRSVISKESIVKVVSSEMQDPNAYSVCSSTDLANRSVREGYEPGAYRKRFGKGARLVIMRPDFIIYSSSSSTAELKQSLQSLKARLSL